jgi:hypothetical protein
MPVVMSLSYRPGGREPESLMKIVPDSEPAGVYPVCPDWPPIVRSAGGWYSRPLPPETRRDRVGALA